MLQNAFMIENHPILLLAFSLIFSFASICVEYRASNAPPELTIAKLLDDSFKNGLQLIAQATLIKKIMIKLDVCIIG